jgi:hypothetical protein
MTRLPSTITNLPCVLVLSGCLDPITDCGVRVASQDMYGAEYFTPHSPRLTAGDLAQLESVGRAFLHGSSVSSVRVARERIRSAYTQPVVLEKLLGERITRLRSLCIMYDRASACVGDDTWPALPNPDQPAAISASNAAAGGASGGAAKKKGGKAKSKATSKESHKPPPCETA